MTNQLKYYWDPSPKVGGGEGRVWLHIGGTAKDRILPEFLYQCHLKVGDQITGYM